MDHLSASQAAELLNISVEKLKVLEDQGLIHSTPGTAGDKHYSAKEITRIKSRHGLTLAEEADRVDSGIQREIVSSISVTRRALIVAGGAIFGYILLVGIFTAAFIASPLETAKRLGIAKPVSIASSSRVLGAEASTTPESSSSILNVFQPVGKVSLELVKSLSPNSYQEVAKVVILDPNDVLELDTSGTIIPHQPISLPESSLLQVGSSDLITNLNSDYLQGRQPGTNPGDIALVGVPVLDATSVSDVVVTPPGIFGLTNSSLSGSAGITNSNLANPSIIVETSGPLTGGGAIALGGKLTIGCNGCSGSTPSSSVSGLTASNLAPGDFSSVINSGTYNINVTGSIPSATNFTGTLLGAVTGTQGATIISSLTPGNFSSADISQWTNNSGFIAGSTADTLTNKTISGATNILSDIENTALTNFELQFAGNSGSVFTPLGGLLTISGGGINTTSVLGQTLTITGNEADTLAAVTGRGATTATTLTLSNIANVITAGTLTANGGTINGTTIGASLPSTGIFTTVNGLILAANPAGFSISGGTTSKTLTAENSLIFTGTDGTTFVFPTDSDDLVGRTVLQTLANKTINAGSNTISGLTVASFGSTNISQWTNDSEFISFFTADTLTNKTISALTNTISDLTNSNLSGSAGITNANLANSSISTSGNIGSGSVALGGTLTFTGSGTTSVTASGSTLTFASTEADTLQSVIARGHTISTTTGGTPNTIDEATIAVGNIASTAQQNFSTLNFTNGGSGFLDVELIRGFINFQGMNTLYEDFTSKTLDTADRWTSTTTGAGSNCTILAGGLNGLFRMHSGAGANRGCELTTQSITTLADGYYQRGNNPILETKLKIDVLGSARVFAGFTEERVALTADTNPNTSHAYIAKRATDSTWQCITDDGGATETVTDTGVTIVTGTFYRLRVELRNGTVPETICTVDNGTTVTRTVVTATQPGSTVPMDVYLKLNQSDTTVKNMDVDYLRAWQDDPPVMLTADGHLDSAADETGADNVLTESENLRLDPESLAGQVESLFNNFFKHLVEVFGSVIFHSDTIFLGRPFFNKDTAGHLMIKAGQSEVSFNFEKAYSSNPVVNISLNLTGGSSVDDIPEFAVYDVTPEGFKIKLAKAAASDISFSWTAFDVSSAGSLVSPVSTTPVPSPVPTITSESPTPSTPTPIEINLSPTPEASPSAEETP